VLDWLRSRAGEEVIERTKMITPDADATYVSHMTVDVSSLEPLASCPDAPDNVKPVREVAGTPINQVHIGSCSNGRFEDIAAAFQGGRDAEGAEKLNGFIDFMYTYIRTCHQIPPIFRIDLEGIVLDGTSLEDINADLTEKLNMIVEVMENNDIISLTDILEYEIKPAFEGLGRYIDELLKAL